LFPPQCPETGLLDGDALGDEQAPRAAGSVAVVADAQQFTGPVDYHHPVAVVQVGVHPAQQAALGQRQLRQRSPGGWVEQVHRR